MKDKADYEILLHEKNQRDKLYPKFPKNKS